MIPTLLRLLQSWYSALEKMRYSLPDEDAREKAAGQSWPTRIGRLRDAALAVHTPHLRHMHSRLKAQVPYASCECALAPSDSLHFLRRTLPACCGASLAGISTTGHTWNPDAGGRSRGQEV